MSTIQLLTKSTLAIIAFVGGWICVTGIQNDDPLFSVLGILIVFGVMYLFAWNEDEMRKAYPFKY